MVAAPRPIETKSQPNEKLLKISELDAAMATNHFSRIASALPMARSIDYVLLAPSTTDFILASPLSMRSDIIFVPFITKHIALAMKF